MEANQARSSNNYYQINNAELERAFGHNTVEEIVKDHWTQGFRKIVHGIGQLFGVRIYGKVILNNDPSSVIYINKCHLNKITLGSGINWKEPQFVQTFIAYVRSKQPQAPVGGRSNGGSQQPQGPMGGRSNGGSQQPQGPVVGQPKHGPKPSSDSGAAHPSVSSNKSLLEKQAKDFYAAESFKYVTEMLQRQGRQLTEEGKRRLQELIGGTSSRFQGSTHLASVDKILKARSRGQELTADERNMYDVLVEDIKKIILIEARKIFIRGLQKDLYTTEIPAENDSPADIEDPAVAEWIAEEEEAEAQVYGDLRKDVSKFSEADLTNSAIRKSRSGIIEHGILGQQDEASQKAALFQAFRNSEAMKNLLSYYYMPVTGNSIPTKLEALMSDEQKMFLLSLLMSVTKDVEGEKQMFRSLEPHAKRLATDFQKDSSRVNRAISTEIGAYALRNIWNASENIGCSEHLQQIVDETFTVLK